MNAFLIPRDKQYSTNESYTLGFNGLESLGYLFALNKGVY